MNCHSIETCIINNHIKCFYDTSNIDLINIIKIMIEQKKTNFNVFIFYLSSQNNKIYTQIIKEISKIKDNTYIDIIFTVIFHTIKIINPIDCATIFIENDCDYGLSKILSEIPSIDIPQLVDISIVNNSYNCFIYLLNVVGVKTVYSKYYVIKYANLDYAKYFTDWNVLDVYCALVNDKYDIFVYLVKDQNCIVPLDYCIDIFFSSTKTDINESLFNCIIFIINEYIPFETIYSKLQSNEYGTSREFYDEFAKILNLYIDYIDIENSSHTSILHHLYKINIIQKYPLLCQLYITHKINIQNKIKLLETTTNLHKDVISIIFEYT